MERDESQDELQDEFQDESDDEPKEKPRTKDQVERDELRELYKDKRKALSVDECVHLSHKITNNFLGYFMFHKKIIDCFLPIHRYREVETRPLIDRLRRRNTVCVPVSNFELNSMEHTIIDEHIQFQENSHGIPEPTYGTNVKVEDIQVVIIPLLVVDQHGNRLGYGKGFYDRFLAECSPKTIFIGLTMFDIHEDLKNVQSFDIPLHYVVNPKGILKTGHAFQLEKEAEGE